MRSSIRRRLPRLGFWRASPSPTLFSPAQNSGPHRPNSSKNSTKNRAKSVRKWAKMVTRSCDDAKIWAELSSCSLGGFAYTANGPCCFQFYLVLLSSFGNSDAEVIHFEVNLRFAELEVGRGMWRFSPS